MSITLDEIYTSKLLGQRRQAFHQFMKSYRGDLDKFVYESIGEGYSKESILDMVRLIAARIKPLQAADWTISRNVGETTLRTPIDALIGADDGRAIN